MQISASASVTAICGIFLLHLCSAHSLVWDMWNIFCHRRIKNAAKVLADIVAIC